jgi:hypothetical protein
MREQPTALELIEAVAHFLRLEAAPLLEGRTAFHARVAANALDIVRREMADGPRADAEETARLETLLGHAGSNAALNQELCDRIATDSIDPTDPALLDHLWRTTLDIVAIDQPKYATYRHAATAVNLEAQA